MKNKEVIVFLILILMISTPMVYADNLLTGYSIFDKIGDFFDNAINFFKYNFLKEDVGSFVCQRDGQTQTRACNTELLGICSKGTQLRRCDGENLSPWSECVQTNTPVSEILNNGLDDNCNGQVDEIDSVSPNFPGEPVVEEENDELDSVSPNFPEEPVVEEEITQRPPAPTYLNYEITNDNHIILTWDNILRVNSETPDVITGNAIYNNNFIDKFFDFVKNILSKKVVSINMNKEYPLYAREIMANGAHQFIQITTIDYDECADICTYEDPNPREGGYAVKSKIGNLESSGAATTGPIHLNPENQLGDAQLYDPAQPENPESPISYTLTLSVNPQNGGKIRVISPNDVIEITTQNTLSYNSDTEIIVWAEESEGYNFMGWTGDLDSSASEISFEMDGSKTLAANFHKKEICNDGIDNNENGLTDCLDPVDCPSNENPTEQDKHKGYFCRQQQLHELNLTNNADDDIDLAIDSLDTDCILYRENQILSCTALSVTDLKSSSKEVYTYSKIPAIECTYAASQEANSNDIIQCTSLKINSENADCGQKSIQNNVIRYQNCNPGSENENSIIDCSIIESCNGYPSSRVTYLNVTEYTTCEEVQTPELIEITSIIKPDENEQFEKGDSIPIKTRIKNINSEEDAMDVVVSASLVNIEGWDEIDVSEEIIENLDLLEDKIFELIMRVPEDIAEGDYRLYVKAYKNMDEDILCKSESIAIKISEVDEERRERIIEICNDGIDNDNNGYTDYADQSCQSLPQGGEGNQYDDEENRGQGDLTDSDNDELPDYWEYNYFGDLSQGAYDDPDNDGITNIDEYRFNTNPKISDKKSSILPVLLIILGIIILVGAIIIGIKYFKNRTRKPKELEYSLNQENQDKLQQFVKQAISNGMNKKEIREALLNAGWKENDINKFL